MSMTRSRPCPYQVWSCSRKGRVEWRDGVASWLARPYLEVRKVRAVWFSDRLDRYKSLMLGCRPLVLDDFEIMGGYGMG